jgi:hypothetical protein
MAIKTHIDPDTGLRRHEVQGKFTLVDIRQTLEAIYSGPDFRPDADVLWDFRDATPDFSADDVRQLAEFVAQNWGPEGRSKAAFVVSSDYQFGMSRMYEMLLKSQSKNALMVFRDFDDAERWLADDKK